MSATNKRAVLIHDLAVLLKKHGDLILNNNHKLTLTTACLNEVNAIFLEYLDGTANTSFHGSSANSDFMYELLFLRDFFQKTPSLKIINSSRTIQGGIDLSRFHSLTVLELKRVPPHLLTGLDSLFLHLEILICQRCISNLKELLSVGTRKEHCWKTLKNVSLSYNFLKELDENLQYIPEVQYLDCSNNNISNTSGIEFLQNIFILNLSYNFITKVPVFNNKSFTSLSVIYLHNNFLETLDGLDQLKMLREVDLSHNCLAVFEALKYLKSLPHLNLLNLKGNPISYHPTYRTTLVSFLHQRVVNDCFCLDGKRLSVMEISNGIRMPNFFKSQEFPAPAAQKDLGKFQDSVSTQGSSVYNPAPSSPKSLHSTYSLGEAQQSIQTDDFDDTKIVVERVFKKKTKKKKKETAVVAVEINQDKQDNTSNETDVQEPDYKKEIEERKKQLGNEWLIAHSRLTEPVAQSTPFGTPLNLDVHSSSPPTVLNKSNKLSSEDTDTDSGKAESLKTVIFKDKGNETKVKSRSSSNASRERRISQLSEGVEVLSDHVECITSEQLEETVPQNKDTFEWNKSNEDHSEESLKMDADDHTDEEENLFLARRDENDEDSLIFISMKDNILKEKCHLTGKVIQSLDLKVLVSAEKEKTLKVKLKFDTYIKQKKEKVYIFEEETTVDGFLQLVLPFMEAKALKDTLEGALLCLKCSSQFSSKVADKKVMEQSVSHMEVGQGKKDLYEADACPNCGSTMVVETDRSILDKEHSEKKPKHESNSPNLSTYRSFSLSALLEKPNNKSQPPVSTSGNTSDTEKDLYVTCRQDTTSDESIEAVSDEGGAHLLRPGFKKSESDITVLSNPSQSSIAVLSASVGTSQLNTVEEMQATVSPPADVTLPKLEEMIQEPNAMQLQLHGGALEDMVVNSEPHDSKTVEIHSGLSSLSVPFLQSLDSMKSPNTEDKCTVDSVCSTGTEGSIDSSVLWELLGEKEELTAEKFTEIDHRVKLFLEVGIFDKEEHFVCALKVDVIPYSSLVETNVLLVVSTVKIYFLKITGKESDEPEAYLQLLEQGKLDCLKKISILLANQGFSFMWNVDKGNPSWYICLLRDADCCNCFLEYFSDMVRKRLPSPPVIETAVSESLSQLTEEIIVKSTETDSAENEVLLYLLGYWKESGSDGLPQEPVSFVITQGDIFVIRVHYSKVKLKLSSKPSVHYELVTLQKICNLTSVQLHEDFLTVNFTFLDEDLSSEVTWTISTKTRSSLNTFLSTIRTPWEELFGIEMPLTLLYIE